MYTQRSLVHVHLCSQSINQSINQSSREGQSVNAHIDSGEHQARRLVALSGECSSHAKVRHQDYHIFRIVIGRSDFLSYSCSCSLMWLTANNNSVAACMPSRARIFGLRWISILSMMDIHTDAKQDAKQD